MKVPESLFTDFAARALTAALALSCWACRSADSDADHGPHHGHDHGHGHVHAESVAPGINDSYLSEDMVVENWVERFERPGRSVYDARHEIVAACRLSPGDDVADIGAGTGLFVPLLAEAVGTGGSVVAVDIVPEFLERIANRAEEQGQTNVDTVQCTQTSVELPENSVDVAFVCDVYHHLEFPDLTLASIHRALRPGGTLVVVEFERIEGVSSEWIMGHVRAGQEVFRGEIEAAGFAWVDSADLMEDTYFLRFRKR